MFDHTNWISVLASRRAFMRTHTFSSFSFLIWIENQMSVVWTHLEKITVFPNWEWERLNFNKITAHENAINKLTKAKHKENSVKDEKRIRWDMCVCWTEIYKFHSWYYQSFASNTNLSWLVCIVSVYVRKREND